MKIDKRSHWTTLAPGHTLGPADRKPHHVLQIVSGQKPSEKGAASFGLWRGFGHAWIRLMRPTGEVYSLGFYPDESQGIVPERAPGLCFPGVMLHPDKYDRVATEQLATDIALTPAQFDGLVQHLEDLQRRRRQQALPFSLTSRNCVHFVAAIAARVGVQVQASGSLAALCADLGPAPLRPLCDVLARRATTLRRAGFNLALYALGGARIADRQWLGSPKGAPESVRVAGLEPLFATRASLWSVDRPIWHTHLLRQWQRSFAHAHASCVLRPLPRSGDEPAAKPAGSLEHLRAPHSGMSPWDGPAGL